MRDKNDVAQRDLPALRLWVKKLIILAERITDHVQCREDDHLGFMALCFLSKQIDHSRSILVLTPSRDVMLIARSMLEGLAQLLWAAQKPDTIPLQWRTFSWVHDWRVLRAKSALGAAVKLKLRLKIDKALGQYGEKFFTKSAIQARSKGEKLPEDPYCKNWRAGQTIQKIFAEVGMNVLSLKLYEPFSDWHHWGAGGLGETLSRNGGQVTYSSLSPMDAASALAVAVQCLLESSTLINNHLKLGLEQEIDALHDQYVAWGDSHGLSGWVK